MPKIRSIADISKKWSTVTPGRTAYYKEGIESPKKDWADETADAEGAYETGVTDAIGRKAFGAGVREAGTGKWKEKALKVGVGRWGPGVRVAGPDYAKGFGPYRDIIEGITLPPRGPRGDPRNYDRVRAIGEALHAEKIGA